MRYRVGFALFVLALGMLASAALEFTNRFNIEAYAETFRQAHAGQRVADPRIVLAGLDDAAMQPEWYNRRTHAKILQNLTACKVQVVFFDLVFDEDRGPENDGPFLNALLNGPDIVLAGSSLQIDTEEGVGVRPPTIAPALAPALESGHVVLGSIEKPPEVTGTLWPYFLAVNFGKGNVPSAALAAYSFYQSVRPDDINYGKVDIQVPPLKIPLTTSVVPDEDGVGLSVFDLKFHRPATGPKFRPGPETYRVIPYLDLLQPSKELAKSLKGAIVVIGENTSSPVDLISTSVGDIKGFEAHAQCIDRLIHRDFFTAVSRATNLKVAAALVAIMALMALMTWPLPMVVLGGLTVMAGYVVFNLWIYDQKHVVLSLTTPLAGAALGFAGVILIRLILSSRFLGRFIPKEAARGILMAKKTALATEATVIVTDIRGYTSLSETRTSVEMLELLNEYHSVTVDIYHKHGGNVLTFQGDAQLVVFGYPKKLKDAPSSAVIASMEVMRAIDDLRAKWGITERKKFDVGAGVCTGLVYVGDIGSREQANYTVIGEVVRTSHKVQSMSDALEGNVLMDEPSYRACLVKPQVTKIEGVLLEGFPEPKTLYRVEAELPSPL